ncbi:hypothetical protein SCUP515_11845 [Seiridium cupressi]
MDLALSPPISQPSATFAFPLDDIETRSASVEPRQQGSNLQSLPSPQHEEPVCYGALAIGLDSSPPTTISTIDHTPGLLQDLFELCSSLASIAGALQADEKCSAPSAGSQDGFATTVQNVLNNTSKLSDLVQCMVLSEKREGGYEAQGSRDDDRDLHEQTNVSDHGNRRSMFPSSSQTPRHWENVWNLDGGTGNANNLTYRSNGSGTPSPINQGAGVDILPITTLVNAYILLIRVWRGIYRQLHRTLVSGSRGFTNELLVLPSLHLGGFAVGCSPIIQISVLLELSSGMIKRIEKPLCIGGIIGLGPVAGYPHEDLGGWCVKMDSMAVSLRETLLSQEGFRVAMEGGLSLKGIMGQVRAQLESRR